MKIADKALRFYGCGASLFNYTPRTSHEVRIGNHPLGGGNPLRLQSMTTTSTNDVEGSVEQIRRIVDAGADYVRLTTQGIREVESLRLISESLKREGCSRPLVADVHFNPAVADAAAAGVAEKVRINPGNYVDPARTFKQLEYTDEEYAAELERLEERFKHFLDICREHGTAVRIGVNHGSLSDRIMCRFGDTPEGIVESCMEFLRVCQKEDFKDVVLSIKASNTVVMVQSVRLLCARMQQEGMDYPLHLGVTEAGEGEDGRIKSAAGIGALLIDGMGDTLRVSLSEAPEREIPVAYRLAAYAASRSAHSYIPGKACPAFDYLYPERRATHPVGNIGGTNLPVVISWRVNEDASVGNTLPDYVYCGRKLPAADKRIAAAYIVDADCWTGEENTYPAFAPAALMFAGAVKSDIKFLFLSFPSLNAEVRACLRTHPEMVVIAQSKHANAAGEIRALIHELWAEGLTNPVVVAKTYDCGAENGEDFQIMSAAETGLLFFDKIADGLLLADTAEKKPLSAKFVDDTAFGILQATRSRTTRTEYISCPGCGRTLYDLQETIARIKAATSHLTGLKIAIMGCIVNGPGEMADADYGYVGAARGKVSLYRGKTCVEKNIPSEDAVKKLLELIEQDAPSKSPA